MLVGGVFWGNAQALDWLRLPAGDRNLILSFHDFAPFRFTHQGAPWVGPQTQSWLGTRWTGSSVENDELLSDFDEAASYARPRGLPVNLGEYGVYAKADEASRVLWTAAMSRTRGATGSVTFIGTSNPSDSAPMMKRPANGGMTSRTR